MELQTFINNNTDYLSKFRDLKLNTKKYGEMGLAIVTYKCTAGYAPDDQHGIIWNDPSLNLNWGTENPALAERDQKWPTLQQQTNLPVYS